MNQSHGQVKGTGQVIRADGTKVNFEFTGAVKPAPKESKDGNNTLNRSS
jgi:hypothetical protein